MRRLLTFIYVTLFCVITVFAQNEADTSTIVKPLQFSVENDMLTLPISVKEEIRVYSSSKQLEKAVEALWQVNIITQEQIQNSGATCIAEALRLVPNVLVRQKSNGHYDVRMKGFAVSSSGGLLQEQNQNTILLLWDNMPLNQYFNGEIFWEAIPVSVANIEKIEVLSAPLGTYYGQNPISGIIHLLSKQSKEVGLRARADLQGGNYQTFIHNFSAYYGLSDKLNFQVTGSYWASRRFQDTYFLNPLQRWVESDSLLFYQANAGETNLYTNLSNQNYNLNAQIHYQPNAKKLFRVMVGTQRTFSQEFYKEVGVIAQTIRQMQQYFLNFNGKINQFYLNLNYQAGTQNLATGYNGYDFRPHQFNTSLEYLFERGKFSIVPQLRYTFASYSQKKLNIDNSAYSNSLEDRVSLNSIGVGVRAELSPTDKWRMVLALSNDFWDTPSQSLLNVALATHYKISDNQAIRIGFATANKAPTVYYYFFAPKQTISDLQIPSTLTTRIYRPNTSLQLMRSNAVEASWWNKFSNNVELNTQVFYNHLNRLVEENTFLEGADQIVNHTNSEGGVNQFGLNFDLKTSIKKFQINIFTTLQKTDIGKLGNVYVSNAPQWFGGFSLNYSSLLNKYNLNLSAYTFQDHNFLANTNTNQAISSQFILNAKVMYRFWKQQSVYLNIRSWKIDNKSEFLIGENIFPLYLLGLNLLY
jgi:iron complex outermembrane receptor protein